MFGERLLSKVAHMHPRSLSEHRSDWNFWNVRDALRGGDLLRACTLSLDLNVRVIHRILFGLTLRLNPLTASILLPFLLRRA